MPRRQYDEEADNRRFDRIKRKGFEILPFNIRKYYGTVHPCKSGKWASIFNGQLAKHIKSRSHRTKEGAMERVRRICIRENFPIKNIMYRYRERYYCTLTQGRMMQFSPQDIELVENHVWCAHFDQSVAGYYALTTNSEGKKTSFLQFMYPNMDEGESGDHINPMEKLNNTRENTRVASAAIQNMNKPLQENNNSGIKGVFYHESKSSWVAKWASDVARKPCTQSFSIAKHGGYDAALQKAIEARNKGITQVEKYKIAGVTDVYEPSQDPIKQPKVRPEDCLPGVRYSEKDKAWIGDFVNNDGKRQQRYCAGKRDDQDARNEAIKFRQDGVASTGRYKKS